MGQYLNGTKAYLLYNESVDDTYFVDKSVMLSEIIPLIGSGNKYICITRPRRFGKTVMANMIAAFLGKGKDSRNIFDGLRIAKSDLYEQHLNQHNVIHISFNEISRRCNSYDQYIDRIENGLVHDLQVAYPACNIKLDDAVWDAFMKISSATGDKFVFVLDEWDFIFHRNFVTERDKEDYLSFLSNLLKDKAYVSLAYMTGILPLVKYSSGSELNMFLEYNMATKIRYSFYYGFLSTEVDELYQRYLNNTKNVNVTREGLRNWYDGYQTASGERMYNPRSVVAALRDNQFANYWTSARPYDEIFYYIRHNVADMRDDLVLMAAGESVSAKVKEYAATSMNLTMKEEIFSAMVVYGFLSYENGKVSIPNKELMDRFSDMLQIK